MTEELMWVARYKDGSLHTQYNVDGSDRDAYEDIVRKELYSFELWTRQSHRLILRVYFDTPDKKLIWRRRVYKRSDGSQMVIYLVGWQMNVKGRNVQSIQVVFPPNYHIETIDRWRSDEYFHRPNVHPHEGEDWVEEDEIDSIKPGHVKRLS